MPKRNTNQIITLSFDTSPALLQVHSADTLYDLVDIAFQICKPRPKGGSCRDHLWNIRVVNIDDDDDDDDDEYYSDDDFEGEASRRMKYEYNVGVHLGYVRPQGYRPGAHLIQMQDIADSLIAGSTKLKLTYDYENTCKHVFRVVSIEDTDSDNSNGRFPRRKPAPALPSTNVETSSSISWMTTTACNLNSDYHALNTWVFGGGSRLLELNLFQAGRKSCHGYLERYHGESRQMIYLPDKAASFQHYMECLNTGAKVPKDGHFNWHSIVVLPHGSKKIKAYQEDTEAGFTDCLVVRARSSKQAQDLVKMFPKTAALGGFGRDRTIPKGWIRYKDETLMIVTGSGGSKACPQAPEYTSYDGQGFHASGFDKILLNVDIKITSIQQLFQEVESFLRTLETNEKHLSFMAHFDQSIQARRARWPNFQAWLGIACLACWISTACLSYYSTKNLQLNL